MKTRFGKYFLPALAMIALTFSIYQVVRAHQASPAPEPPIEPPRTPFGKTIAGSGIVEAETENISIGAPLPGVVLQVYVPVDKVGQIVIAKTSLTGNNTERVDTRVLQVIYRLDRDDPGWYVGMQVDVFLNGDGTSMSAK